MRRLAILLLQDPFGISSEAWDELKILLEADDGNEDIVDYVRETKGRFYLPADFQ